MARRAPLTSAEERALENLIVARYKHEGAAKIAAEFGLSQGPVKARASKLGIRTIWHFQQRATDSTTSNIHFFKTLTPEAAYILGYIYGDGSIDNEGRRLTFACQVRDRALLENIRRLMGSNHTMTEYQVPKPKNGLGTYVRFRVCSSILVHDLQVLGVKSNKSNEDSPVPSLPLDLYSHFTRGFFDADGSIVIAEKGTSRRRVDLLGSKQFIQELADIVYTQARLSRNSLTKIKKPRDDYRQMWCAQWYSLEDITRLYHYLYKDQTICLERKRLRFPTVSQLQPKSPDGD